MPAGNPKGTVEVRMTTFTGLIEFMWHDCLIAVGLTATEAIEKKQ